MPDPKESAPDLTERRIRRRQAVVVLVVVFSAIFVSQTLLRREPPTPPAAASPPAPGAAVVTLVVDNGRAELEQEIAWRDGLTVLEALESVPDRITIDRTGEGADAFVTAINGVENRGAAGKYWQYEVNGVRAELGAGSQHLEPGDRVLWKFAPAE